MSRRKHGSGNVEHRGDGTYRLRYRIGGTQYKKTIKADSPKDAEKALRALLHAGHRGTRRTGQGHVRGMGADLD